MIKKNRKEKLVLEIAKITRNLALLRKFALRPTALTLRSQQSNPKGLRKGR